MPALKFTVFLLKWASGCSKSVSKQKEGEDVPEKLKNQIAMDENIDILGFNVEQTLLSSADYQVCIRDINSGDLRSFDETMNLLNTSYLTQPPNADEYENESVNFEVNLTGEHSGKNSWVYSSELRKAYIKMEKAFIVRVSYNNDILMNQTPSNLFLRIMAFFTDPEDSHMPVRRCLNHQKNDTDDRKNHIFKIIQPQEAQYEGSEEKVNYQDRLSIKIPMDSRSCRVEKPIGMEFLCQNSCTSGINRRCTALIFALETEDNRILGKRVLQFKICSCPKRDKDKEEQDRGLKRKAEDIPSGSRKKIFKAIVKKEVPSPTGGEEDIKSLQATFWLPDRESEVLVRKVVINTIGNYIADTPPSDKRLFWEQYRNTLRSDEQTLSQSDP